MRKLLMHKNIEVAVVETSNGKIEKLLKICNADHMPVGTCTEDMSVEISELFLQSWQSERLIPEDRLNLLSILAAGEGGIPEFAMRAYGANLTDCYWFKNINSPLRWEDINFYKNGFFSSSLTLNGKGTAEKTPDFATNGCLPKTWIIDEDGQFALLKAAPHWLATASANEVIASRIADLCQIPHAACYKYQTGGKIYCASVNVLRNMPDNVHEEFVPLWAFKRTHKGVDLVDLLKEMKWTQKDIDCMTTFDLLIGNTDRHEGNLGSIRDADTLEFLRPAPLFDNGNCLLGSGEGIRGSFKPLYRTQQSALVHLNSVPFEIPEDDLLRGIVSDVYTEFGLEKHIPFVTVELLTRVEELREQKKILSV